MIVGVADRVTAFVEVYNFRDLGGYRTADGRSVAWRRLFRSDDLSRLTTEDAEPFAALGIRTVIDLRRPTETAELGRVPEFTGVDYRHVHLIHQLWPQTDQADAAERISYLVDRYRDMSVEAGDGIGTALRLVAEADAAPLVVHCIAGKDRTGIVAALTLSLLGVDDATIATDYALTEAADRLLRTQLGKEPSRIPASPPEAMLGFLAGLRSTHGSVEAYVKGIGVTDDHIGAMRAHLLA
jgi:protein tyrosine/serine phosphatase